MYLKRPLVLFLTLLLTISLITGCGPKKPAEEAKGKPDTGASAFEIVDMEGRTIKFDAVPEKVVAIGSALRLYTYVAGTDKLAGVEKGQQNLESGRPYILANPGLKDLPIVGEGHPADPDPELLLEVNPDVIIAGDIMDKARLENLEKTIGIPVVMVTCGDTAVFDKDTYEALSVIGKTIGREERAQEVIKYMEGCKEELAALTKGIPEEGKPRIYVGALSHKGTHGIESTAGKSPLLDVISAKNVADEVGTLGPIMIDKEKLIEWDPDIIIIDENGLSIVREDYKKVPEFYEHLAAVKNGKVYGQLPYVAYYNNVETAMADIYFVGKILYPDAFTDIDPAKKADEIYEYLLGMPLYDVMAKKYGGFVKINLGE